MLRKLNIVMALLLAAASASVYAAAPSGRLGRELLQSGVTCAKDIPHCAPRRCTTRILGSKETYVCLRCQLGFVPVRGIDGKSVVQCVCPPGRVLNSLGTLLSTTCEPCPVGSYCPGGNTNGKNENLGGAAISCNPPDSRVQGLTTKSTGASRPTDCVAKGGYVLPATRGEDAQTCTGATYAPENNRLRNCLRCQSGLEPPPTFTGPNEDRLTVCQVPPGRFWEFNVVRECAKGLYRDTYESTQRKAAISCKSCPDYWTTEKTGSFAINQCNILVPGYQVADGEIISQDLLDNWNPTDIKVDACPIGTYFNATATNYKCTACPHGSVTRAAGALSIDECMVPPGYFISKQTDQLKKCLTSNDPQIMGYYRSGWISFSQALDEDDMGTNVCTPCGTGIMSQATEADENPRAVGEQVAATSASCYIDAGYGISFDPSDFRKFRAVPCPANTYGVADVTFGLISAPCKACGKNLRSNERSKSFAECKNPAGFGYTSEGANQCPPDFWAEKDSMAPCEPCPEGRYTEYVAGEGSYQDSINDCKVKPGHGVYDPVSMDPFAPKNASSDMLAKPCPVGFFSKGDSLVATETGNSVCKQCPTGQSTTGIGSSSCNACAAGYGGFVKTADSCRECGFGQFSSMASTDCTSCPITVFADPVGAAFRSHGLTFRKGLTGKETCVPLHAQMAPPTGDRMVLPDTMFKQETNLTAYDTSDDAIQEQVRMCVTACPPDMCCITQMQLQGDGQTLNCKHALLEPEVPFSADNNTEKARLYYKLPPSEMAASSINDKEVAAKTIASGIYAVCNISAWTEEATLGKIGTSFENTRVDEVSRYLEFNTQCKDDKECQEMCNAESTCWGYIAVGDNFALRGGEASLGGRTFFTSPIGAASVNVEQIVSTWL